MNELTNTRIYTDIYVGSAKREGPDERRNTSRLRDRPGGFSAVLCSEVQCNAMQCSAMQQTKEKQNIRSTHKDPDTKPNGSNEDAAKQSISQCGWLGGVAFHSLALGFPATCILVH